MGEAEDAERERRREKKREKKRHAKLIDVNVSEQDVEAALARRRKTEEESDAGEGKKKSKKQRMEKRQKEQQEEQQAEQQGNPQEAFSSQKRFLDQRSAGTGLPRQPLPQASFREMLVSSRPSQTPSSSPTTLGSRVVHTSPHRGSPCWAADCSEPQEAERGGVEEAQGACAEGPQGGHAVRVHVESRQGGPHDALEVQQTAPKLASHPSL
jgi:hypothetical protein